MCKRQIISALALFVSGCSSVAVKTPLPQIETPTVAGRTTIGYVLRGQSAKQVQLTDNAGARPPSFDKVEVSHLNDLEHALMLGLGSRLQIGGEYGMITHMPMATAKLQIFGSPRATAKAGNFAISAFGRSGWQSNSSKGDQATTFGPGGYPWRSKANLGVMGYGGSAGVYLDDTTVLYGGVAFDRYRASARIDQDASSDGTSAASSLSTESKGWAQSAGGGLSIGRTFAFNLSVLSTRFKWDTKETINELSVTVGFEVFALGSGSGGTSSSSAPAKKQ